MNLDGAAEWLWVTRPHQVRRLSTVLAAIVSDGGWLRRFGPVALVMPVVAVLWGVTCGLMRDDQTSLWSASMIFCVGAVLLGGTGAALGLETGMAFAIVDFIWPRPTRLGPFLGGNGLTGTVALIVANAVLLVGVAVIPLCASSVRARAVRRFAPAGMRRRIVGAVVQASIAGVLTYAWTQSAVFLIRPVWVWQDQTPPLNAIQGLQRWGWVLAVAAALAAAVHAALDTGAAARMEAAAFAPQVSPVVPGVAPTLVDSSLAQATVPTVPTVSAERPRRPAARKSMASQAFVSLAPSALPGPRPPRPVRRPARRAAPTSAGSPSGTSGRSMPLTGSAPVPSAPPGPVLRQYLPLPVRTFLGAAWLTLYLSGFYLGFVDVVIMAAGVVLAAVLRRLLLPRVRPYVRAVAKVPLIVRLLVVAAAGYAIGLAFIPAAYASNAQDFRSVVISLALAFVVGAFVLPDTREVAA